MDNDTVIRLSRVVLRLARPLNAASPEAALTPTHASGLGGGAAGAARARRRGPGAPRQRICIPNAPGTTPPPQRAAMARSETRQLAPPQAPSLLATAEIVATSEESKR